ncbi:MAG: hypothetical protein ACI4TK_17380 [Agathobacter sp.]
MEKNDLFKCLVDIHVLDGIDFGELKKEDIQELVMRAFVAGGVWSEQHQWMVADDEMGEELDNDDLCVIDVWDDENDERLGLTIAPWDAADKAFPLPEGHHVTHYMRIPLRKGMNVFTFDVMVGDMYEATLHYRYSPVFPFTDDDIKEFVESEIPTLKGRKWRIAY